CRASDRRRTEEPAIEYRRTRSARAARRTKGTRRALGRRVCQAETEDPQRTLACQARATASSRRRAHDQALALLRLKRVRIGAAPRVDSALPYDSHPHGYCGPGGTQWRHLLSEQATSSHLEQTTCIDVGPVSSYSLCQLYLESSFHEPLSPQSSGGRKKWPLYRSRISWTP